MSEEKKKLIDETVKSLKHLDKESLLIIKSGVEMLKSRDSLEDSGNTEDKEVRKWKENIVVPST